MLEVFRPAMRSLVAKLAIGAAVAAVALWGIGFVLLGLYLGLRSELAPPVAALATGFGALALAGLTVLLLRLRGRRRTSESSGSTVFDAVRIGSLLRRRQGTLSVLALAAGVVMGMSPAARRAALALLILGGNER